MKERPILFSAPMVRAILEGRKTQTRRVMKPQPTIEGNCFSWEGHRPNSKLGAFHSYNHDSETTNIFLSGSCHLGTVGDRLWVKETWLPKIAHTCGPDGCDCCDVSVEYIADGASIFFPDNEITPHWVMPVAAQKGKNVPSLFMPRWASRILLEITDIRVERLNDISEQDAIAEGCVSTAVVNEAGDDYTGLYAKEHYFELWDSIHGEGSWLINPWVWCINFKVIEGDAK
jgi:hypothetical protein